jgi:hypothetical protein
MTARGASTCTCFPMIRYSAVDGTVGDVSTITSSPAAGATSVAASGSPGGSSVVLSSLAWGVLATSSRWQLASQPSHGWVSPSSHCSAGGSGTPLPHPAGGGAVELVVDVDDVVEVDELVEDVELLGLVELVVDVELLLEVDVELVDEVELPIAVEEVDDELVLVVEGLVDVVLDVDVLEVDGLVELLVEVDELVDVDGRDVLVEELDDVEVDVLVDDDVVVGGSVVVGDVPSITITYDAFGTA